MYEAVLKGQYTVEQFSTLFQQRQGVKRAIFSQLDGTATLSTSASSDHPINSSDLASTTLNFIASSYPEESTDLSPNNNRTTYQVKHYQSTSDEQLLHDPEVTLITGRDTPVGPSYPACSWTAVRDVGPNTATEPWQSLDAVVNGPTKTPPSWEV